MQRSWVPVWSLSSPSVQSRWQPTCLVVVSNTCACSYGTVRGLFTDTLDGTGWAVEARLRPLLPVDEEGSLVNRVVGWVRGHPEAVRVAELAGVTADFRAVAGTTPGRFLDDQRPPGQP